MRDNMIPSFWIWVTSLHTMISSFIYFFPESDVLSFFMLEWNVLVMWHIVFYPVTCWWASKLALYFDFCE